MKWYHGSVFQNIYTVWIYQARICDQTTKTLGKDIFRKSEHQRMTKTTIAFRSEQKSFNRKKKLLGGTRLLENLVRGERRNSGYFGKPSLDRWMVHTEHAQIIHAHTLRQKTQSNNCKAGRRIDQVPQRGEDSYLIENRKIGCNTNEREGKRIQTKSSYGSVGRPLDKITINLANRTI